MAAARGGGLPKLEYLSMHTNPFGEEGVEALAEAIEKGHLPALKDLKLNEHLLNHPRLRAACEKRGVRPGAY